MCLKLYALIEWNATKPIKGNMNNRGLVSAMRFVKIGNISMKIIERSIPAARLIIFTMCLFVKFAKYSLIKWIMLSITAK